MRQFSGGKRREVWKKAGDPVKQEFLHSHPCHSHLVTHMSCSSASVSKAAAVTGCSVIKYTMSHVLLFVWKHGLRASSLGNHLTSTHDHLKLWDRTCCCVCQAPFWYNCDPCMWEMVRAALRMVPGTTCVKVRCLPHARKTSLWPKGKTRYKLDALWLEESVDR